MRGREFIMKDAYSFDCDDDGRDAGPTGTMQRRLLTASSPAWACASAQWKPTPAPSAAISRTSSWCWPRPAKTPSPPAPHAATPPTSNAAEVVWKGREGNRRLRAHAKRWPRPAAHTVEEVARFLKVPVQQVVKTMLFVVDGKPVAVLVRGDREVNDIKLKNYCSSADEVVLASADAEMVSGRNASGGLRRSRGLSPCPIYADHRAHGRHRLRGGRQQGRRRTS